MDQKKKKSVGLGAAFAVAVAAAGMSVLGNAGDLVDGYEDPTQGITVTKYQDQNGAERSKVNVLIDRRGGLARTIDPKTKEIQYELNYFARKLAVDFVGGGVDANGSCVTLGYHFSTGEVQKTLNLKDDVVQAYLDAVSPALRPTIVNQMKNVAERIDNNDPDMAGPMSFMTNEVCGQAALDAYPEEVKIAEQINRAASAPQP